MRFRHTVTLKAILVTALFLAHLAVPAKLLEPFGLNSIRDGLGAQKIRLAHGDPERYYAPAAGSGTGSPRGQAGLKLTAGNGWGQGTSASELTRLSETEDASEEGGCVGSSPRTRSEPRLPDLQGSTMFSRASIAGLSACAVQPQWTQVRNMATLKDITRRLKSIKNIQKITKSMKMVAAAKYARAERELKPARVYGTGSLALYEKADIKGPEDKKKHLLIGVSSDRGLCGAIHSSVAKQMKNEVATLTAAGKEVMIVGIGEKIRGILYRTHSDQFLVSFKDVGRKPPTFGDASVIALELLNSGFEFDEGSIIFNQFKSVISYKTQEKPIFSLNTIATAESMSIYDDIDADVLQNYQEYNLANIIYYSLKESTTSEQSARMTAMDNASKNASEMIDKLTLTFNRTRQAVITKELIEIISGAAALD